MSDDSVPLELAVKPFVMYDEGRVAMQELCSTKTTIASLISDDGDRTRSEALKELKTHVEKYEDVLVDSERDGQKENKPVRDLSDSKLYSTYALRVYLINLFLFRKHRTICLQKSTN